jgi:ferredoxin
LGHVHTATVPAVAIRDGTELTRVVVVRPRGDGACSRLVRISLEADKCQGHNRCYALAPELFDVDDLGQSVLLVEGEIPEELVDKARLAAANCPEFAIKVVEA